MERLTSREPRVSGVPGVCCTHFEGSDCQAIQGRCADGCLWEEAAWDKDTAMFLRRGSLVCSAYFVATASEDGLLLSDFILKGMVTK